MSEKEINQMSAVGKKLWLHMQDRGPYNMRAFARMLKRRGILETSHQAISKWLHSDRPAPYFVNAVVQALDLTEQEEIDLHYLYFYGEALPTERQQRIAHALEVEAAAEERGTYDATQSQTT